MYWCKSGYLRLYGFAAFLMMLSVFTSCKPDLKENGAALKYFDLKGYFSHDTAHLNKQKLWVNKTVAHNGITETKKVRIDNWGREFDLFFGSDINKPAWKNSYTVTANDEFLIYKTKDPTLNTQEIIIRLDKQQVKWMLIFNRTYNHLYQTAEKLTYYPDSLYQIEKLQKVRFLGSNSYTIKGTLIK